MSVQPTRDVDYREAEKTLVLNLKTRGMSISLCREWARWTYGDMPFWSVWGLVYDRKKTTREFVGIHIYDDGRVEIICSDANSVELEEVNYGKMGR